MALLDIFGKRRQTKTPPPISKKGTVAGQRRDSDEQATSRQSAASLKGDVDQKPSRMGKDTKSILRQLVITEKSRDLSQANKYVFAVDVRANRKEIQKAVEQFFKVSVLKVNTIRLPQQIRGSTRLRKIRPLMKKAVVTLAEGSSIEIFPK